MKKIAFLIVALLMMIPVAAVAKKKQASAEFEKTSYNFGAVAENGGPVSHEFTFTNTGDANLVIVDARADCGCTKPEYPLKPVAPGAKGKIKVTFNPKYQASPFSKTITVQTNGKQKKVRLKITGTIVRDK